MSLLLPTLESARSLGLDVLTTVLGDQGPVRLANDQGRDTTENGKKCLEKTEGQLEKFQCHGQSHSVRCKRAFVSKVHGWMLFLGI